jgi:phosphopantothenoylcysteine decarboxylase/phosphopantothenate--cysteine ligase
MHPSEVIRGRRSDLLAGRHIVVGVSGSIAAVEVPRLIRELLRHGATVDSVLSPEALRLVTREAVHFASGRPPVTELTGSVEHIRLLGPGPDQADLLLLAPATANTLGKIAHGIDDTPVTTFASVALGNGVPVLVAPAMHQDMAQNPFVKESMRRLESQGVSVIPPLREEGEEKIPPPEVVAAHVLHRMARGPWAGRSVVVVGGASVAPVDEVRYLGNASSGRMALELAAQAFFRGATVSTWLGDVKVPIPTFLPPVRRFRTLSDLRGLLADHAEELRSASAVLVPAALSDYSVAQRPGKIPSEETPSLTLQLAREEKILPALRSAAAPPTLLVGFKLEPGTGGESLTSRARASLERYRLDAVVANALEAVGGERTVVTLVRAEGRPHRYQGSKTLVAGRILDDLSRDLPAPVSEGAPGRSRGSRSP